MSEKDVVENVDSPGEISIPTASNSTPGIASLTLMTLLLVLTVKSVLL